MRLLRISVGVAVLALSLSAQAALITIGGSELTAVGWGTLPPNPNTASEIEAITGSSPLSLLYRNDGGEEGLFAGSYSTIFGFENETASIVYDGGSIITGNPLYLVAKDGVSNDPIWYIFDITTVWNGVADINIGQLWPQQGSISWVGIYGGGGSVPDGGTTAALLAAGLGGLAILRRRIS